MSGIHFLLASSVFLVLAYVFYGAYLSRKLGIDPARKTPAHLERDGVDYVPARKQLLSASRKQKGKPRARTPNQANTKIHLNLTLTKS